VSEYQYYEFRAIDRPLDDKARAALRAITSRARITRTSLVNEYHYGDFKGDPEKLMEKYFDAHLYYANWGSRQLMLRVPVRSFDFAAAEPYLTTDALKAWTTKEHVIFDFHPEQEDSGEWNYWEVFGEGDDSGDDDEDDDGDYAGDYGGGGGGSNLASLLPLREELMAGDLRALYIGWLAGVYPGTDDDATEPPVPPGLQKLSGPLTTLVELLAVDSHLIEVAAGESGKFSQTEPAPAEFERWAAGLPTAKKDQIIVQLVQGGSPAVLAAELARQFRDSRPKVRGTTPTAKRRTVGELFAARDRLAAEKAKRKAKEQAEAAERRAREAAAKRAKHLESLVGREDDLWAEVEAAVAKKLPKEYDRAIELLRDLRDLAERAGRTDGVAARIMQLRERHAKKSAFLQRLDKAGFTT
jgi:hypothetical protein